ncbi:MAG: T9SS type A sorting domain-containing protein [Bacteroidota bacterium]
MKKATLSVCALFAVSSLFAQRFKKHDNQPYSVTCSEFHITKPLWELFANNPLDQEKVFKRHIQEDRDGNVPQQFPFSAEKDGPAYGNDPSTVQHIMGTVENKAPIHSWAGQSASGMYPLDPTGAAGTNNYVQMINSTTFKIWSKTGTAQLTGTLGNLWSSATANDGDPIVMYDKAADRWFMSQFGQTGNKIYIAISTTNDPTGSWYTFTFTAPFFPDYLKFSTWGDGYYMTCNSNSAGSAPRVFVFERTKMLLGNAAARMVSNTYNPPYNSSWFFIPLTADVGDGTPPVAGTPCPIFSYSDNGWGGSFTDAVNVFNATVNWVPTTATLTITSAAAVTTAAFDATYNSNWDDVSQPGTSQKLDGIGGALMIRAQYKSFASYNAVTLCWGVQVSASTGQRGIKWCELRQTGTTWAMYQQGIYAPTTDNYWMGSIAMDNNENIALCYLKSNATSTYPSLCYTGRKSCDALGTMTLAETVAKAGTGAQTSNNRDGDYAETWLDPDGVTFWHTGMYLGSGGSQQTQVYSFQIAPCASVPPVANFTISGTNHCAGQSVSFTDASTNTPTSWSWSFPGASTTTSTAQNPSIVYPTAGTYTVTLIASNSAGSNTHTTNITVNAIPATPTLTSNSPLCAGSTISFTTPTVSGATYAWTGPASFTSTTQNASRSSATTAMAGTYSLTVTVNGCTSSAGTVSVAITAAPTVANAGPNQTVCPSTATLAGNTATVGTGVWTLISGTGTITTPSSPTSGVTGLAIGANVFQWTITNPPCTASSSQVTITRTNSSVPTPTITQAGATLSSSAAAGNQWYWNGNMITGATGQTFTPTVNGNYTVIVTVSGCTSTVSNTINITNAGISDLSAEQSLELYPNPNDGVFTVSFVANSKSNYKLEVVNALGQLVYKQSIKDVSGTYSQKIDITTYGKGVYLLLLVDDKNQTVKKVLVY